MLKVNQEVSSLLTSFASTVSTMRDQAEREAASTRTEADGYAEHRREEADRLFDDQSQRATAVAEETLRAARHEAVTLARTQAAVEQSLRQVAEGVFAWLTTLERLRETTQVPASLDTGTPPDGGPATGHPAGGGAGPNPAAAPASSPAPSAVPPAPSAPADPVGAPPGGEGGPRPARPPEHGPEPDRGNIVDFRPRPDPPSNGDT
jgi:hypothetical protein